MNGDDTVLLMLRFLIPLSILWAAIALGFQVVAARGGGRKDYSHRAGSACRGVVYNFTVAMTPSHKETVSRHPVKFLIGAVMHLGVVLAMLSVVVILIRPEVGSALLSFLRPLTFLSLACGVFLFARRIYSKDVRAMSTPEDYVAILLTCVLLVLASLDPAGDATRLAFVSYAGLLFAYLPLGKLRHAIFFFVARADFGGRLGYRGVYPPSTVNTE